MTTEQLKELLPTGTVLQCHETVDKMNKDRPLLTKNRVIVDTATADSITLRSIVDENGQPLEVEGETFKWGDLKVVPLNPPFYSLTIQKPFVIEIIPKEA